MMQLRLGALTGALALMLATAPAAGAQSVLDDPEVQAQVRLFSAWMEGQIEYRGLPGVVVGVVAGDELVWAQGYGHADVESDRPMATDTRFRMASHSKLFTATAIMQLRDEGKLRLDDPVTDYLPWFEFEQAEDDDLPVTIEHLLTHSSGLPREAGSHWTDWDFPTRDEVRALMPMRRAPYAAEVRWKYSNLAYTIAGLIVEEVSGMTWADYLQENIFDPLGMSASSVDVEDPLLATPYGSRMPDGSRERLPFVDARGMAAATGLTSTVEDMARFVSAQFREGDRGGDRILATSTLRQMHRVRMMETTWTRGQGIGFSVSRSGGGTLYVGHGGGYPGNTTNTTIQLDAEVGVIVLTNTNDSNPNGIAGEVWGTIGEAVIAATAEEPEEVAWDPAWEEFAGTYTNRWGRTEVVVMNEKLVMMNPWSTSISTTELEPIGDGTFRLVAQTGGGAVGEIVRFEEVGDEIRLITGDSYRVKVR